MTNNNKPDDHRSPAHCTLALRASIHTTLPAARVTWIASAARWRLSHSASLRAALALAAACSASAAALSEIATQGEYASWQQG